jgi:hypothetical protein
MSHPSIERLLTVHGLRLSGLAPVDVIAGRHQLDPAAVERTLADAEAGGLARQRGGTMPGWMLTPKGRRADTELLADELDAAGEGVRAVVDEAYRAVRRLDGRMRRLRTDWDTRDTTTYRRNDHIDAGYDTALVGRLAALHAEATPIRTGLAAALDRFTGYGPRFDNALANVVAGRVDWFTHPLIDSYDTVWFELHEDLLATLAVERSKEDMF